MLAGETHQIAQTPNPAESDPLYAFAKIILRWESADLPCVSGFGPGWRVLLTSPLVRFSIPHPRASGSTAYLVGQTIGELR
jgi:hypothetical protein